VEKFIEFGGEGFYGAWGGLRTEAFCYMNGIVTGVTSPSVTPSY